MQAAAEGDAGKVDRRRKRKKQEDEDADLFGPVDGQIGPEDEEPEYRDGDTDGGGNDSDADAAGATTPDDMGIKRSPAQRSRAPPKQPLVGTGGKCPL